MNVSRFVENKEEFNKITEEIKRYWKVTDKPGIAYASGRSVEYLSVTVTARSDGFFLSQSSTSTCLLPLVCFARSYR